jgi:5-carboxyvanillate decarboxylase
MNEHRVIAVEEHFATRHYLEVAAELDVWSGDTLELQQMRSPYGASPWMTEHLSDIDTRLAVMDASGTDMALLSLNPPGVQAYEPVSAATALVERANDELADVVRDHPTRFAALGAVAPQDPHHAAGEIERIMGPLGFAGLMICSHTRGQYLDEPMFEPLLAAAEAHGATIYLHPRMPTPQMIGPYRNYGMTAAVWGFQADGGTHAVRLMLSGVLDRHPDLKFVLGHLGEGIPFWMPRLDNRYAFARRAAGEVLGMPALELTPTEYLRRNFAITTSGMDDEAALRFCLERLGQDSILFAIDYPYEDSAAATRFLRSASIPESARAKISHINAERWFKIPPAS